MHIQIVRNNPKTPKPQILKSVEVCLSLFIYNLTTYKSRADLHTYSPHNTFLSWAQLTKVFNVLATLFCIKWLYVNKFICYVSDNFHNGIAMLVNFYAMLVTISKMALYVSKFLCYVSLISNFLVKPVEINESLSLIFA